jgi:hypothetical protein
MNEILALDAMKKSKHDKKSRDLVKHQIYLRTRGQGLKKYAQPMSCGTDKYVGSLPDLIRRYTLILSETKDSVTLSTPVFDEKLTSKAQTVGEQTASDVAMINENGSEGIEVLEKNLLRYYTEYSTKLLQPWDSLIVSECPEDMTEKELSMPIGCEFVDDTGTKCKSLGFLWCNNTKIKKMAYCHFFYESYKLNGSAATAPTKMNDERVFKSFIDERWHYLETPREEEQDPPIYWEMKGKRFIDTEEDLIYQVTEVCYDVTDEDADIILFFQYYEEDQSDFDCNKQDDYEYSECIEMIGDQASAWCKWI